MVRITFLSACLMALGLLSPIPPGAAAASQGAFTLDPAAAPATLVCDGIGDGTWNGCRGTGCSVCQEKLAGYDCYFQNHPECILNTTCQGLFYDCDAACPQPTAADRCGSCDGIGDGTWNGCRGTGCSVCQEKLAGYDCYFDNHPDCILNTTCQGLFYDCDAACPAPSEADRCGGGCVTDTCTTCTRPGSGVDNDFDGVPDRLEYDLAHQFFPAAKLQGFDDDLEEVYVYRGLAMPFSVKPLSPRSICNEAYECLEVRWGVAYRKDTGDTIFGISGHPGDSEFYAALVMRTTSWSTAKNSVGYWQMIRDFTAAHWRATGDSSRYGVYGHCSPYCPQWDRDVAGCTANSEFCVLTYGQCVGGSDAWGTPCGFHFTEGDCWSAGGSCMWSGYLCDNRTSLPICDTSAPVGTYRTLYAAEGKHGLYHSKYECDNGGFLDADACPHNAYNLRSYKGQLLMNVGNDTSHAAFDTIMQHPDECHPYDVWGGAKFADSSPYDSHFKYAFSWVLP